jgi:hypothetical protein
MPAQGKLEKLLAIDDEETFKAGLAEDFRITPNHPKYDEQEFGGVGDSAINPLGKQGNTFSLILLRKSHLAHMALDGRSHLACPFRFG